MRVDCESTLRQFHWSSKRLSHHLIGVTAILPDIGMEMSKQIVICVRFFVK